MTSAARETKKYIFSTRTVTSYFNRPFTEVREMLDKDQTIFITDEHVYDLHREKFGDWKTIVIPPGEKNKNQQSADQIIQKLIEAGADRNSFIVGVGGGVVTDMSGYVASIYMRGIRFGFVPTTVLAMVDACMGGKNGVDVGIYKNLVGTINQPEFLLYDFVFLKTLPEEEWRSGFAEIIKHACINDAAMFDFLEQHSLRDFMEDLEKTGKLVEQNVDIKYSIVSGDETETGARKLLNFGHTIGHAIENTNRLLHGYAISIGMVAASAISGRLSGLSAEEQERISRLLVAYGLPISLRFDKDETWEILLRDKKKSGQAMNFVLLEKIGIGTVKKIALPELRQIFDEL